jgi:hypothetical protein
VSHERIFETGEDGDKVTGGGCGLGDAGMAGYASNLENISIRLYFWSFGVGVRNSIMQLTESWKAGKLGI